VANWNSGDLSQSKRKGRPRAIAIPLLRFLASACVHFGRFFLENPTMQNLTLLFILVLALGLAQYVIAAIALLLFGGLIWNLITRPRETLSVLIGLALLTLASRHPVWSAVAIGVGLIVTKCLR
jgi:apolipoprotein N-acyltransferase